MAEQIRYVGATGLSEFNKGTLDRLSTAYHSKLKRALKNNLSLAVHVKGHQSDGGKQKFSIHVKCDNPGKKLSSDKHHDFSLAKALHKGFGAVMKEAEHLYHNKGKKRR
jgi:hypothetical protein